MTWDFSTIKNSFTSRLSLLSNWATTLYYGVYDRLADAVAYVIEKLAYLAEFYYQESSWANATKLKNLATQAEILSYTPYRKKGASGNIILSADSSFDSSYIYTGESVSIPKWTQFSNQDEDILVYATTDYIYYANTEGNLTIAVKEGEVKEFIYTAEGLNNETITIFSDSIDEEYIQVDIVDSNETVLYNVNICGEGETESKLYYITDLDNYYCEVTSSFDFDSVKIKFGDNIYGKRLNPTDKVKVTYVETEGEDGNITNTGVITKIKDTLIDANGDEVTLYITNEEEISNGEDIETLEHIRNYAPKLFVAGYRCGGADDWQTNLENHQYIQRAQVLNMSDIGSTNATDVNKVFVTAISTDGSALTASQKTTVATDLKNQSKKSVTEIISWRDPEIIFLLFDITAKVENQPFATINTLIDTGIDNAYGILNVEFKENIYQSNYINTIDDIQYIDHHTTEVYYLEKNVASTLTNYELAVSYTDDDTDDYSEQIYLQPNTLQVWMQRKQNDTWNYTPYKIAEDQSGTIVGLAGDLTSGSTYTIVDSAINYDTNIISFGVNDITTDPVGYGVQNPGDDNDTGYIISLAYKTQDGSGNATNDIRLPTNQFITDVDSNFIFTDLEYV